MHRWLFTFIAATLAAPAFAQLDPQKALASMKPGDGLQVELFAAEPMVLNPTAIDVDHMGRVWVTEAVNYRRKPPYNRPILRKEGDRIVVLTDTDGDGKADKSTVFYQSEAIYGPLSVCVIPTDGGKSLRVLVAQSPDILEFTCKDANNPVADGPPKKFLTGFGGIDHDHGVHGLHLGPDGKLYFTVGDSGVTGLQSADGKGKKWVSNTTDVQKGTVWRCDLSGNNLELIAHNFRNNYEVCVDSFGEIWLSDNDDDGNQQTRICHVYPGGNYGYGPRGPGQTHWHEEQPGIVHKTLRTGFGSPTGIQFYEGNLLPKQYANTLMHCDAGPMEVRAFTRKLKGAGYELDKTLMLTSSDKWFRPSDVCTAPDGSVFVADWYDPGVGGHGMGDWTRGRIYRLTPTGHKGYKVPEVKLDTEDGVMVTLGSPCLATRAAAQAKLLTLPMKTYVVDGTQPDTSIVDPRMTARGLATCVTGRPKDFMNFCMGVDPVRAKIGYATLLRLIQNAPNAVNEVGWANIEGSLRALAETSKPYPPDSAREVLLLLRGMKDGPTLRAAFFALAKQYDGQDIFYRAALNIACGTDPARRDAILADFEKHFPEWNDKVADLVWELRPKSMLPKMETLMGDAKLTAVQKARIVDILAASDDLAAGKTMLGLLKGDSAAEVKQRALENLKLFLPTKWKELAKAGELKAALDALLAAPDGQSIGLQLAAVTNYTAALPVIKTIVNNMTVPTPLRIECARTLGALTDVEAIDLLDGVIRRGPPDLQLEAVKAMAQQAGRRDGQKALASLQEQLLEGSTNPPVRQAILSALAGSRAGTGWLLKLKEDGKMPEALAGDAGRLLRNSPFQGERNKAYLLFPAAGKLDPKKLPPITDLAKKVGSAENGKRLMAQSLTGEAQCLKCHTVRGVGGSIGPDLSMIGKKGSKENLYDSLLTPSKAIADQYVSWRIDSEDGQSVVGLLVEEMPAKMTVRDANGKDYTFAAKDVTKKKDPKSIMPEDVIKAFSEDELIDVVEYLMTLQTPSFTPDSWLVVGPFPAADDKALDKEFDVKDATWKTVRSGANGYFDLAAYHGDKSANSVSYLRRTIESPADQEVTIRLGTDDGCRMFVNGQKVFGHERQEAARPDRDQVTVKLKKGANEVLLKIGNGNNPHGFYLTIDGGVDLKVK
jgi:putative membrane-bound dehydrogenase-like protein